MRRSSICALVVLLVSIGATVGYAITNGGPDNGEHPYVGELLFYVPDEVDSRFTDPGSWFGCSGTLVSPTVVVTAGHCTFGIGLNGTATSGTGGSGGNDVWVNFSEAPDFTGFPASADYIPDNNAQRYIDRAAWLNSHPAWVHGTAYPHPQFTTEQFLLHDAGVVVLDQPVALPQYGALPTLGLLDQFLRSRRNDQRFTDVGYGLTHVLPIADEGGDTREKSTTMLVSLTGQGLPYGTDVMFTNDNGKTHQGGTCFGDSGGPVFVAGTNQIVAVTSWGWSPNCTGFDAAYRIDQQDDLDFIAQFLAP